MGVAVAAVAVAAVVTAGPVLAAAVGYTSGVIAAGATLATATVAAGCGGGMVAEAVTGVNPIKEAVGDEAFDVITTVSTAGAIQGASNISSFVGPSVGSSSNNTSKYISRGSTGRTEPANLTEKLAMEQVKSNPSAGKKAGLKCNKLFLHRKGILIFIMYTIRQ